MFHFKQELGWKACYDDENNIYTAKTSWRGTFDLYEINAEIYHQLGEPDVNPDALIHSGRHLYHSEDSPIGPPTDMVVDENYAALCPWTNIQASGNVMSKEMTELAIDLLENEETRAHREKQRRSGKKKQE